MRKELLLVFFAAVLLSALPAFAQDQAASARTAAGCGPSQTQFDVKLDDTLHLLAQPEEGKAIVYVFEDDFTGPTMRIGSMAPGLAQPTENPSSTLPLRLVSIAYARNGSRIFSRKRPRESAAP